MAKQEDVAKLNVTQLKELAEKHNVEVASSDKKDDLVKKVSAGITPENLEDYNKAQESAATGDVTPAGTTEGDGTSENNQQVSEDAEAVDGVERDHTPAGTTEEANASTDAAERVQPPVAANGLDADASDEAYEANTQVNPALTAAEVKEGEHESNEEKVETRKAEAVEVETELGTSEEEVAAQRAGVPKERLENPVQNREPKNVFEESNQKVTEEERQAAQKVSDMSTSDREENAPTPNEAANADATRTAETNQGADIAAALVQGLKDAKGGNFELKADEGVEPRFSLVKNKEGRVLVRENETGHLSEVQLKSIEEKEASIQDQEVEEL